MTSEIQQLRDKVAKLKRERDAFAESLNDSNKAFMAKVKEFSIIKRISDSIRWSLEPEKICRELVQVIIDETNAENCSLWMVDGPRSKVIRLTSAMGQMDSEPVYFPNDGKTVIEMRLGDGVAGHVAKTGVSLLVPDVEKSPYFKNIERKTIPIKSLLCIPLNGQHGLVGVLNLSHPDINAFSRDNELLLQLITDQAALAFSNSFNFQKVKRDRRNLERIIQERTANLAASEARYERAVLAGNVAIWDYHPESGRIRVSHLREMLGFKEEDFPETAHHWMLRVLHRDRHDLFGMVRDFTHGSATRRELEIRMKDVHGRIHWFMIRCAGNDDEEDGFWITGSHTDVTERKEAEKALEEAQAKALANAHAAGKAEFATSILHNVGNVLSSVNVSCNQIKTVLRETKLNKLLMANDLIEENIGNLAQFFATHAQGKLLPKYLLKVGRTLAKEYEEMQAVARELESQVQLISDIVKTQQADAKDIYDTESYDLASVAEDAMRIQMEGMRKRHVRVEKDFLPEMFVKAPKAKLTHILINLIKNAVEAMEMRPLDERDLVLKIDRGPGDTIVLTITDSGIGISEENLKKMFTHGFTTKEHGHGFGLHYCHQTMQEFGGSISVDSPGPNRGATFTLTFPATSQEFELQASSV